LQDKGHEVIIAGRIKDITVPLLEVFGIHANILSTCGTSFWSLAWEYVYRSWKILTLIRHEKPDVLVSVAGTFISLVGKLTGIPVIIFYDTEIATVSNFLAFPFSHLIVIPSCYRKKIPYRHITYSGYHELAYLHPDLFSPNITILKELGLGEGEKYVVIRFVSWESGHDLGKTGFPIEMKRQIVSTFSEYARVYITSEKPLPPDLERYRFPLGPDRIHDALFHAALFFGESATMASESVVLGTPAIYIDTVGRGYTDEQEKIYGALFRYSHTPHEHEKAMGKALELLKQDDVKSFWSKKREKILSDKINVTSLIVSIITSYDKE
jgi:predicted glycosyltransferase